IGTGVVTDLLLHGISAVVVDISEDILQRAQAAVLNNVRCVPLLSKTLPRISKEDALQRMVLTTDLHDVASCDFIIENVTEDWDVKKPVYEKIDMIFKQCFGHKMGPLETADLIGLDTVMRSLDVLYESFHDPKYRCCPLLRKLVHAGHLGRKTGKGFHVYPDA